MDGRATRPPAAVLWWAHLPTSTLGADQSSSCRKVVPTANAQASASPETPMGYSEDLPSTAGQDAVGGAIHNNSYRQTAIGKCKRGSSDSDAIAIPLCQGRALTSNHTNELCRICERSEGKTKASKRNQPGLTSGSTNHFVHVERPSGTPVEIRWFSEPFAPPAVPFGRRNRKTVNLNAIIARIAIHSQECK